MSQIGVPLSREDESEVHSQVDRPFRYTAVLLVASSINWLLLASVFGIITSIKLQMPQFLGAYEWLTYGRVEAAFNNAMIFGWLHNAAYAVGLWVMLRLCRISFPCTWVILIAGAFWNLAVLIGVIGILAGDMTAVAWMGMPTYASALLVFTYATIAAWGVMAFMRRKNFETFVSQWYFLAALMVFPFIYIVAQVMIFCVPSNGVVQALLSGWFAQTFLGAWLASMGLGIIYYLAPTVLDKPIRFYYLARYGFWMLLFFFGLSGARYLIGGPVPASTTAVSTAAAVLLLVPAMIIAANIYGTVFGSMRDVMKNPILRFTGLGFDFFMAFIVLGAVTALCGVAETTRFTFVNDAYVHAGAFGFLSMVLFGGIYYMLPKVLKRDWPCTKAILLHWWLAAIGNVVIFLSLLFAGWYQGEQLNNPQIPVADILHNVGGWLQLHLVGVVILTASFFVFALNFYNMICRCCCRSNTADSSDSACGDSQGGRR